MKKGVVCSFQGRLQREAKVSGLRDFRTPSLEAVERRRLQLWAVTLGILLLVTGAVVVLSITPAVGFARSWTWPLPVRLSTLLLAVGCKGRAPGATAWFGQGVAGHVARTREPLLPSGTVDEEMSPGLVARTPPVDSAICVPLTNRGRLLGVLNISAPSDRLFSEY